MVINPIVGVYIPIIRIPIKGGMTIPNIATFDHGTYSEIRVVPWVGCNFSGRSPVSFRFLQSSFPDANRTLFTPEGRGGNDLRSKGPNGSVHFSTTSNSAVIKTPVDCFILGIILDSCIGIIRRHYKDPY